MTEKGFGRLLAIHRADSSISDWVCGPWIAASECL